MKKPKRLSAADREDAFRGIRADDLSRVVRSAKLLADDREPDTTGRLVALLETEWRMEVRQGVLYALAWHARLETWDLMVRVLSDVREHPHCP